MRTHMAATSLTTFHSLSTEADLQPKEARILSLFGPGTKLSRQQISRMANLPINTVTGRVFTLLEKGALIEEGIRIDPITHKPQALLRLPTGQLELPL